MGELENLVSVVKFYVIFGNRRFYMSRIGKLPIKIPENVEFVSSENIVTVKGKFGILKKTIPDVIEIKKNDNVLNICLKTQTRTNRALHGLYRTLINNMVIGVSEQFKLVLNLKGVGYRASVQNQILILNLVYSHTVEIRQNTTLNLKGCDKENLGLFASNIRSWRPPEPYKGKGIIYENEIIKRKAGKSGKK